MVLLLSQGQRDELRKRARKDEMEMRKKHRAEDSKAVMNSFRNLKLGELKKGVAFNL